MLHITTEELSQNLTASLQQVLRTGEPLQVDTQTGSVILLAEQQYHDLLATLEVNAQEGMRQKILEGRAAPLCDCLSEEQVSW